MAFIAVSAALGIALAVASELYTAETLVTALIIAPCAAAGAFAGGAVFARTADARYRSASLAILLAVACVAVGGAFGACDFDRQRSDVPCRSFVNSIYLRVCSRSSGLACRRSALVAESCRRAQAAAADGIFTALVPPEDAVDRASRLQRRADDGENLPLLGMTFAVKDNIHVAGMATTSNCPGLSIMPEETAHSVQLLEEAGAVLIGKNTMDQFATGLNGTRSPEPLCRNAINPNYIPGGSSSGSAVAVARDIVAFSLGSDTGGSGRVPAACNGIVGLKPTIGLVSSRGLLYNSRILDCVPIFARNTADAYEVLELIAGHDTLDPFSRPDAARIDVSARTPSLKVLAIPKKESVAFFWR